MNKSSSTKSKICSKCLSKKPLAEFYKDSSQSDGLQKQCKKCISDYQKGYRKKGPFEIHQSPIVDMALADQKLGWAADIKRRTKSGITFEQGMMFINMLHRENEKGVGPIDWTAIFERYILRSKNPKSVGGCHNLLKEVIAFSKEGMTPKQYWEKGRPFKSGLKVAYKKKNKK